MTISFQNAEARRIYSQVSAELAGIQKINFTEAVERLHTNTGKKITSNDLLEIVKKEGIVKAGKIINK